MFGSEISLLAIPLTAALTLDAGPLGMGVLAAAATTPSLLFGLFAGAWVDRLHRRRALIVCDLARAGLLLAIPIVWAAGFLTLAYLSLTAFLAGLFTVFFEVAHASYLPSLLPADELVEANSQFEISESITQLSGPSTGGVLVQLLSAPFAIAVDAVSFLISALLIAFIRAPEAAVQARAAGSGLLREVGEGLRYVANHPLLRATAGLAATTQLCMSGLLAVYILYLVDELRLPPALIGLIGVAAAPGTVLGASIAPRLVRQAGLGPTMAAAAWLPGLAVPLIPLAGSLPGAHEAAAGVAVGLLALAWFILGLGSIYDISEVSLRQAVTPDPLRGRVNATRHVAFYGVMPVGAILGGLLGASLGLRPTMLIAAAGLLLAPLWILASPIRNLRKPPPAT
jgi:MFS family permease